MADPNSQGFDPQNANTGPPEEKDRSLFHHEAKKHECHHYTRMYGGKLANAMLMGFGMDHQVLCTECSTSRLVS